MNIWILIGIFVILDLALITFVIVVRSSRKFSPLQKTKYLEHWRKIKSLEGKEAVMEADKLLDEILGKRGYAGSMADKLKKAGPAFTNVNDVWSVHKLRNRLAHELGAKISPEEAKSAIGKFERALKDLGL
jgi:uncharacterized protein YabN with tetrapyrrole methylase and pyrophosphatase domain